MTYWIISWGTKVFRPRISSAASTLAKHGAHTRKLTERERLIATTAQLCREMGKPLPKALVR